MVIRSYIEGIAVSTVWKYLNDEQCRGVFSDLILFVEIMVKRRLIKFSAAQGRNLATPNPHTFLNYYILIAKLTGDISGDDIRLLDKNAFPCIPTLCHRRFTLDHLILKEDRLCRVIL